MSHKALYAGEGSGVELETAGGVADFLRALAMHEWEILAVRAPIKDSASAYARLHSAHRHLEDVADLVLEEAERGTFAIQLRQSPWSLIVQAVDFPTPAMATLDASAQALSRELKTSAVSFLGTDTSLSVYYQLFDRGTLVERVAWDDEELTRFESKRPHPKQGVDSPDHADADHFFKTHGIYLPVCSLSFEPPQISLENLLLDDVLRVDWIELEPLQSKEGPRQGLGAVEKHVAERIKKDLTTISQLVPSPPASPLRSGSPTLKDFHRLLKKKDFDDALEVLEILGKENACRGTFWRNLQRFAERHHLMGKAEDFKREFKAALKRLS